MSEAMITGVDTDAVAKRNDPARQPAAGVDAAPSTGKRAATGCAGRRRPDGDARRLCGGRRVRRRRKGDIRGRRHRLTATATRRRALPRWPRSPPGKPDTS
jgi:hypothetical protein